jgi:hypothetical protein
MSRGAWVVAASALAASGCKGKREAVPLPDDDAVVTAPRVAADAASLWPELEGYPLVQPERVVTLPAKPDLPRFDVGGPVIAGDVAVIASSQFGFLAIDWRRGAIAWTKPAGLHVAPPIVHDGNVVLIGECAHPPVIADDEALVGCLRVVSPAGADLAYLAIRGRPAAVEPFAGARGKQALWLEPDGRRVRWRRGDAALAIDLFTGAARPVDATPPALVVEYEGKRWDIHHTDEGRIVARSGGKQAWATQYPYTAILGSVWLPEMSPMLRVANLGAFRDVPEVHLLDIDATGSLRAAVARPAPGIGLLGWATSSVGDAALAVRVDTSLRRDLVVGYAANALLMWVYPLPEVLRPDRVGVAIAPDAVVVFHDGDTFTVLPELSAPPTTPGAPARASRNPTP